MCYEMLAEQVEAFVGFRRAQLRREAGERRQRQTALRGASLATDEHTPITTITEAL